MVETTPANSGAAPAAMHPPGLLVQLRPVAYGFAILCASLAAGTLAVAIFGSAVDGDPAVSIPLISETSSTEASGEPAPAKSFLAARSLAGHLVADPELIEDSLEGPLPKRGPDGREARTAYARPFDKHDNRPKIAIVIGGLGVGASVTETAIKTLPPAITLGYVPFGGHPQIDVDRAREAGHEVLLEVPMEPFDFPSSDPGPHALLTGAPAEENIKRFRWALSRFTGYAGFTHLLGARFLSETSAIEPILQEASERGLYFFDSGTSARSLALTAARHANASIATGTLILDEVRSAAAIDDKLVRLEAQARSNGFAIGTGSPSPVTILRIAEWAAAANERGFHLVPVSALARTQDGPASP